MKIACLLLVAVLGISTADATNLYIYNNSPTSVTPESSADAIFMSELRKMISHDSNMNIVSQTADLKKWQQQQHGNDDVLLELNCGPLDDGNGVGPDGQHIEVVAFSIWLTEKGKPVSLGSSLAWFRIDPKLQRTTWNAHQAATTVANQVKMMSIDNALLNSKMQ